MCDGIKTYALGYWICVMVLNVCTRVLDMCDDIKTYTLGYWMCHGIKAYALGYWICVMVLKRMYSGTGYV